MTKKTKNTKTEIQEAAKQVEIARTFTGINKALIKAKKKQLKSFGSITTVLRLMDDYEKKKKLK